jgi:hypothetical protein
MDARTPSTAVRCGGHMARPPHRSTRTPSPRRESAMTTNTTPPGVPTPTTGHDPTTGTPLPRLAILPTTTVAAPAPSPRTGGPSDGGTGPAVGTDVASLPPTLNVEQAATILGCGRTLAYALVRRGEFPSKVLRLGNRYVIPTADLLRVIGIDARAA